MSQVNGVKIDERRLLVERVSASSYFNRSARLRDLLHYLTERVLEDENCEIREHEVGHKVFGRSFDYDTAADNIVRVHASMLRKRLEQFFLSEGLEEPFVIEIPKGNYAPLFRSRPKAVVAPVTVEPPDFEPVTPEPVAEPLAPEPLSDVHPSPWLLWALAGAAVLFGGVAVWLLARGNPARSEVNARPAVRQFWSHVFSPNRPTDIVFDDAAVALYQELSGKPISLSEYFDRSYLRGLPGPAVSAEPEASLTPEATATLVLRRQSSFSSSSFYWKLTQMPESAHWSTLLRFARDYSFRELKSNNSILLGNGRTNPWVQPFETRMGIHWQYDKSSGTYFPANAGQIYRQAVAGDVHEGYCSIALLPNLGGTGNVLVVAATGGSALSSAADFLADESSISSLQAKLGGGGPYFEALIRLTGRSTLPRDASIVIARRIKPGGN
jgi:hypothetical protein